MPGILLLCLAGLSGCWMAENNGEEEVLFNYMDADYSQFFDQSQQEQCEDHQDCMNGWACYEGSCIDPERFDIDCSEDEDCPEDWFCVAEEYCSEG